MGDVSFELTFKLLILGFWSHISLKKVYRVNFTVDETHNFPGIFACVRGIWFVPFDYCLGSCLVYVCFILLVVLFLGFFSVWTTKDLLIKAINSLKFSLRLWTLGHCSLEQWLRFLQKLVSLHLIVISEGLISLKEYIR